MTKAHLCFEEHPKDKLHVMLFDKVDNSRCVNPRSTSSIFFFERRSGWIDHERCSQLLERIKSGRFEPEATVFDGELVMDLFPLSVAANKALTSNVRQKMVTRSLHSELLHNLSGSKHIIESLRRFGISPQSNRILIARFNASEEDLGRIRDMIKGEEVQLDMLPEFANVDKIKKLYGIGPEETEARYIVESILIKMATKDIA